MKRILAMAAAMVLALPAHATPPQRGLANSPGRWAPRDGCTRVPGAAAFRAQIARAIARRDAAAFAALAIPDVALDFGDGKGRALLRQRLASRDGRELWHELDVLVRLGCDYSEGMLTLPWFTAQDLGELGDDQIMLATGANVPLYEVADSKARVLYRLSWQLVDLPGGWAENSKFQQVDMVGMHRRGYVETAKLRSQADYRLVMARRGGAWRITAFLAGD